MVPKGNVRLVFFWQIIHVGVSMVDKPAVLISDDQVAQLAKSAICKVSFQELTGTQYPWEIDLKAFQSLKAKLDHIEDALRSANPVLDITCVLTGQGAFWQPREGIESFLKGMDTIRKQIKQEGPYPIWKLTSAEMFSSHLNNMRQLIMAAAHDLVLIDHLKDPLGNNHILMQREFEQVERHVRILLDEITDQGGNLEFAMSKDIILLERVRITEEMFNQGLITEQDLGYSLAELESVQSVLERRCEKDFPKFRQRLQGTYNQVKESLRNGECTQLRRVSHWEMAFAMIGIPPIGYQGQSKLASTERDMMTAVVASREMEAGPSQEGQTALTKAEESRRLVEPGTPPPLMPEEPVEEPAEELSEASPTTPKKKPRMAIMDRLRR